MFMNINLFWIAASVFAIIFVIVCFLIHNGFSLRIFSKHDEKVIEEFLMKYPDVSTDFMRQNERIQNIENNQEIHEINKRFDVIEANIESLSKVVDSLASIVIPDNDDKKEDEN